MQPGITIPDGAQSVTIGKDGIVTCSVAGPGRADCRSAQLQLADFVNPPACSRTARTCWSRPPPAVRRRAARRARTASGYVEQGSLEGSNVNVVEELVNMIETQRAYEMNSKAISTTDQMLEYVTNQL